jgi:Fic family protein
MPTNGPAPVYVVVEDKSGKSKMVVNANPSASATATWAEWRIALSDLTGVNLTTVKKLYETLGAGIDGRSEPEYRKEMPLHRAYYHEIAQPARIPLLLAKLCDYAESAEFRNAHPIQRANRIHHGFMQIFPFTENSGRVARLLSNLVLLGAGYLPVIIHATDRQRYYDSLRMPEGALRDLTMEAIENGLAHAEKLFASVQPARRRKAAR